MTPLIEAVRRYNAEHKTQYHIGTWTNSVLVVNASSHALCHGSEEYCVAFLNSKLPADKRVSVNTPSSGELDQLRDALRINQEQLRNVRAELEEANKQIADMKPVAASSPEKDDLAEALVDAAKAGRHIASCDDMVYVLVCHDGSGDVVFENEQLRKAFWKADVLHHFRDIRTAAPDIRSEIRSAIESRRKVSRDQAVYAIGSGDLDTLQKWIDQQRDGR